MFAICFLFDPGDSLILLIPDLARREEDVLHINHQLREVNAAFREVNELIEEQDETVGELANVGTVTFLVVAILMHAVCDCGMQLKSRTTQTMRTKTSTARSRTCAKRT